MHPRGITPLLHECLSLFRRLMVRHTLIRRHSRQQFQCARDTVIDLAFVDVLLWHAPLILMWVVLLLFHSYSIKGPLWSTSSADRLYCGCTHILSMGKVQLKSHAGNILYVVNLLNHFVIIHECFKQVQCTCKPMRKCESMTIW